MTLESKLVRNPDIMAADMDGSTVMMDIDNGMYYNLGEVGGTIWNILEAPISVNALVDKLTSEYDVSREKCLEDTIPFLNALLRNKLIAEAE